AETEINSQYESFKQILIDAITTKEFADLYAQTVAYGMFAARINDSGTDSFTRQTAANAIPQTNPFLRKMFQFIAGYDLDSRISWVVDSLADLFNHVDIDKIRREIGRYADNDPIIHFYETFLTDYDKKLKKQRGVWYTPQPVVQFIVRAVDEILKTDFELPEGLADTSKVTVDDNEYHKVQILDPAAGTGTFLAEVINRIYKRFENQKGMWQNYVNTHLIPRLNGFEILMASYAMAHLKLELLLQETNAEITNNQRLKIYLTDSLEPAPNKQIQKIAFAKWLTDEANEAAQIKRDTPVMVILGNPPYSKSSSNKGKWIVDLCEDYKKDLNEQNILALSDDYIKFIRLGQYFVEKNGGGILAYISNNSFIDGLIHRQMRKNLLHTFDKIYILDLHGNSKKKETAPDGSEDKNVFDIMQGVSINILVKKNNNNRSAAQVFHYDLFGKRPNKYSFLLENNLQSVKWNKLKPTASDYFFVPKDFSLKEEYEKGVKIDELFQLYRSGVTTANDKNLISFHPFKENNYQYAFSPLDIRYINYDLKKVQRPRHDVMQYFIKGENIGLIMRRNVENTKDWKQIFVSNNMVDGNYLSARTYIFPLYLCHENFGQTKKVTNLNEAIVSVIAAKAAIPINNGEIAGQARNDGFELQIFDYIYAVLHSPSYRERYKEFLKIDFPRIPYPENAEEFKRLAELGAKLRKLHLMENVGAILAIAQYPKEGDNKVEKLTYENNKVWINDAQYFDNVPSEAWNFYIGGYQPGQKWLKDRKGRTLNYDDICHYQRIIAVLCETETIMKEIDVNLQKFK
ncbi:MAG: N-6 DNA methylase, partial [Dysgonamonadaceae bacterium]|nr:N-6 DNA methylase [Dysgonamonadaceae bacterium]